MPSNFLAGLLSIWFYRSVCWTPLKLDLLPTEARISGKEYKERVVNNLKILIVHYSVHQSHSKAVKRAISEHCGVWTISMLSYFYCFQCIGISLLICYTNLLFFWCYCDVAAVAEMLW
ncbi:uncharacterized protein LOC114291183 [Camellia sinensis]|uniref:uncharacterized protein LOC114291183 n=1 Tax=Camellia sinensis TaxID=4442 RepID=UPI001035A1D4|nr:uncharacterized protein LOC114291183 [Camellia sinensis]